MSVPLLDLKAQYRAIRSEIDAAVREVFESQYFILGPKVLDFEAAVAKYCGVPHACGISSGTDALLIAMMAEDIGPGDEVITTPYTFFATAGCIARLGAKPVFVDIDPVTFNINVSQIEKKITPHTKAIIPVHLYGQVADMDAIMAIAGRHKLVVIEDACQAIGAEDKGRRAGSMGHYGCFSFFPSKNLGGAGDGGMVVTRDAARDTKLRRLRNHGMEPKYYHHMIGGNFRLDALQAAVLNVKLRHLDAWSDGRQANAKRYDQLLEESGLVAKGLVKLPKVVANRHIFNQYVVRVVQREKIMESLRAAQAGFEIYYPVPLHLQECFAYLGHKKGDFPESEKAAGETLALPIYPELTEAQAGEVVAAIKAALA